MAEKSGLNFNDEKTDACLFYKLDIAPVGIKNREAKITSKSESQVMFQMSPQKQIGPSSS
jgi:hypothetical protein